MSLVDIFFQTEVLYDGSDLVFLYFDTYSPTARIQINVPLGNHILFI